MTWVQRYQQSYIFNSSFSVMSHNPKSGWKLETCSSAIQHILFGYEFMVLVCTKQTKAD